jgi:ribonuclease HII
LKIKYSSSEFEAGCDEVGRGRLSGPVVASAVIFPDNFKNSLINDSKKLTAHKRESLRLIIEEEAIAWAVSFVSPKKIDEINILNANILAMQSAISKLSLKPDYIVVDGNIFKPYKDIQYSCVVKVDTKYLHIAAASILAKTHRDEFMKKSHLKEPVYNWFKNKGYPTIEHRKALMEFGSTKYHRKSFKWKNPNL